MELHGHSKTTATIMTMASVSPSSSLRRKPNHIACLSVIVATVFMLASLVPLSLKDRINITVEHTSSHHISNPSQPYPISENAAISLKQSNMTDSRRRLLGDSSIDQDHRQLLLSAQFRLHSGFLPPSHPSQPYFVNINEETGRYGETFEYGSEHHPLSRLVDFREHKDGSGPESVFFFVVPKANGGKMKTIMTNCFNLRRTGKRENPESMTFLKGVLNVDTQTMQGLAKAKSSNIIDSGLVDVFDTSHFFEGMMLFKPEHRGRAFTILQHPVLNAESMYLSRDPSLEEMGFMDFIKRPDYVDNWVVRSLTNDKTGVLTEDHLLVAKGVLARKFFIGVAEYFDETIKRLELYYGWEETKRGCVEKYLKQQQIIEEEIPRTMKRGSKGWNLAAEKNKFDLTLYYYALEVFTKQGSTAFNRPYVDKDGKPIDFLELKKKEQANELAAKILGLF